jgi:hypothetical protein
MRGKSTPRLLNMPRAAAVRSLRRKKRGLLPLCFGYAVQGAAKSRRAFFEKSKKSKKDFYLR